MESITDAELTALRKKSFELKERMEAARRDHGESSMEYQYANKVYRDQQQECERGVMRWIAQGCKDPTS